MELMGTLYIRDVADEVTALLKERAAAQGQSLSAYVGAELTRIATRPTRAEVVAKVLDRDRSNGPTTDEIVAEIRARRGE